MIFILLCLAYFSQHNVFRVHSCGCISFLYSGYGCPTLRLSVHLSMDLLGPVNNAAVKTVQVSSGPCFHSCWVYTWEWNCQVILFLSVAMSFFFQLNLKKYLYRKYTNYHCKQFIDLQKVEVHSSPLSLLLEPAQLSSVVYVFLDIFIGIFIGMLTYSWFCVCMFYDKLYPMCVILQVSFVFKCYLAIFPLFFRKSYGENYLIKCQQGQVYGFYHSRVINFDKEKCRYML